VNGQGASAYVHSRCRPIRNLRREQSREQWGAADVSSGGKGVRGGPGSSSRSPGVGPSPSSSSYSSSRGPLSLLGGLAVAAAHQMQPPSQPVPDTAFLAQLKALHDQGISLDELFRQKMGSAAQEPSADMTQSPQAPGSPVA